MKKYIYVFGIFAFALFNCSTNELVDSDKAFLPEVSTNFADDQSKASSRSNLKEVIDKEACFKTRFRTNKGVDAGFFYITIYEEDVKFTFQTIPGWDISETYLGLQDCKYEVFPSEENGHPMMSHFDYGTAHGNELQEYSYVVKKIDINESLCYAAYAVVVDEKGYSYDVWANKWMEYNKAYLADCNVIATNTSHCVSTANAEFFIPLKESTSGTFPIAGSSSDSATLTPDQPSSEGYLDVYLNFNNIPEDFKGASITISFKDLDLYTDTINSNGNVLHFSESFILRDDKDNVLAILDGSHTKDGDFTWTYMLPHNTINGRDLTLRATFISNLDLIQGSGIQVSNTIEEMFDIYLCGGTEE